MKKIPTTIAAAIASEESMRPSASPPSAWALVSVSPRVAPSATDSGSAIGFPLSVNLARGCRATLKRALRPWTGRWRSVVHRLTMPNMRKLLAAGFAALVPTVASADCFWSHVDHVPSYNASGMWNPKVYRGITDTFAAIDVAGALWEGADTRIGRTMWQSADTMAVSAVATQAGKFVFTRARPSQGNDPCLWFQGGSHYSFPSGEAAFSAALVTPFVLEYASRKPATYALLLLPLYVGTARMKNHAHWPTDIVAGWAIGAATAWYDHSRKTPIFVSILPRSITVGFRQSF